ncbi:hypothetical protein IE81DRAFT_126238 [Ceraceosorus guamensis]|uniref:Uncharacterized protein n=1 Tax=Ceraceosorus guamensis TaxID=1522189 RepID=A0A316W9P3_9BASI|nr:hypothetical protein IE81DRAFT_126238 [Ceraceosorus guamensis]PWN45778.1 hypothetical protein IE81DRAFT_126238 [Ceraceosorus guamensis]
MDRRCLLLSKDAVRCGDTKHARHGWLAGCSSREDHVNRYAPADILTFDALVKAKWSDDRVLLLLLAAKGTSCSDHQRHSRFLIHDFDRLALRRRRRLRLRLRLLLDRSKCQHRCAWSRQMDARRRTLHACMQQLLLLGADCLSHKLACGDRRALASQVPACLPRARSAAITSIPRTPRA